MVDLIQATSRGVKGTLTDGTVRFVVEVEPQHANAAFMLFGMPGAPVVIARLTQEAATAAQQAETIAGNTVSRVEDEKPVGGDLARLAARFCRSPDFHEWLRFTSGADEAVTEDDAIEAIRFTCGVKSRAELDHNETAKLIFHEDIRKPFAAWCRARGIA